jgi:hypothetical protein
MINMPQETKSMPANPDDLEVAPGTVHENLEGWIPALAGDAEVRAALEKAFDFRGDITIGTKSGNTIEGYIFDRRGDSNSLSDCYVRLLPKDGDEKVRISYDDVARLEFTGKDTAAGKSFATWVKKYQEKKAAGEKNIGLEPEKLD